MDQNEHNILHLHDARAGDAVLREPLLTTSVDARGIHSVDRIQAVARLSAYSFQRLPAWAAVHFSLHDGCAR